MVNNTIIARGPAKDIAGLKSFLEDIEQAVSLLSCEDKENEFIAEAMDFCEEPHPEYVGYEIYVPEKVRGPENREFGSFDEVGAAWDVAAGRKTVRKLRKKLADDYAWCDPDAPSGYICPDHLLYVLEWLKRKQDCLLFGFQSTSYNTCKVPFTALSLMFPNLTIVVRQTGELFLSGCAPAWCYEFSRGSILDEYLEGITEVYDENEDEDEDEDEDETSDKDHEPDPNQMVFNFFRLV